LYSGFALLNTSWARVTLGCVNGLLDSILIPIFDFGLQFP